MLMEFVANKDVDALNYCFLNYILVIDIKERWLDNLLVLFRILATFGLDNLLP